MGGVELFDKMRVLYRMRIRSKKWYWPFIRFCINGALVNMWILYWYVYRKMGLLTFIRRIVLVILTAPQHQVQNRSAAKTCYWNFATTEQIISWNEIPRKEDVHIVKNALSLSARSGMLDCTLKLVSVLIIHLKNIFWPMPIIETPIFQSYNTYDTVCHTGKKRYFGKR